MDSSSTQESPALAVEPLLLTSIKSLQALIRQPSGRVVQFGTSPNWALFPMYPLS